MRRILNGVARVPVDLFEASVRGWDQFVFTPADPTSLGLIRVMVGSLLTWSLLLHGVDLAAFFAPDGWTNLDIVLKFREERVPDAWSFWFYVPETWLRPVWGVCLGVLVAFTIGLKSRWTAPLAWIIAASTARRLPIAIYGFDNVVETWALYLAVTGASGQAVSLDRYLARWKRNRTEVASRRKDGRWTAPAGVPQPSIAANISLRLIQCHLILIYGMSGLAKLRGNAWWEGTAIWGTLAAGEFRYFDLTWLASYPLVLNALTHGALALEVTYPALVWPKGTRGLMVAGAVAMHAGIGLTIGLFEFSLAMIAGNFAFVSGPWLRSLVAGRDQPSGRVLYDGACPRCRASMAFISAGDPDRVVDPVDLTAVDVASIHASLTKEACLRSMHLVHRDGRVEVGYWAVMRLLAWTPLTAPLALVRFLPGVSWVGQRVYDRIAASRPRDVPCTDEVCGIHPPGNAKPARPTSKAGAAAGNRRGKS